MAQTDEYYKVLGIGVGATDDEVRAAYRDLAKVWHPDRFPNNDRLQKKAQEKLKEINAAYEGIKTHRASQANDAEQRHRTPSQKDQTEKISRQTHNRSSRSPGQAAGGKQESPTSGTRSSAARAKFPAWLLLFVSLVAVAALVTWKPWERNASATPSIATNAISAGLTQPPPTNSAPATNDVISLMNEGTELVQRGDIAGAIQRYRAAMKINPEDEEVYFNLAFAFTRQGNTNEAIHYYNEALRIFPDYAEAHNNLGNLLVGLRRHTEALEHFSAALKVNPESSSSLNNLGRCLAELGKRKEALVQFNEAIRVNPTYLEARFNLANTHSSLGEYDEAIQQFEELLRMEPRFTPAKTGLDRAKAKQAAAKKP